MLHWLAAACEDATILGDEPMLHELSRRMETAARQHGTMLTLALALSHAGVWGLRAGDLAQACRCFSEMTALAQARDASAARPAPGRPRNTYVREDQILPHLAAVAILLASGQAQGSGTVQVTAPAETAYLIDQLRTAGVTLTYDPATRTIRTGGNSAIAVTVGRNS
jgi:hypothetical protein